MVTSITKKNKVVKDDGKCQDRVITAEWLG